MNRQRLEQVIRVMGAIEADVQRGTKEFDMRNWRTTEHGCGTAYCAVGWCMLDPWFNEQGLTGHRENFSPRYNGNTGWLAVMKFFDLDEFTANMLFNSDAYASPSPRAVIRRITQFLYQ